MDTKKQQGFLVLADISGYSTYLTQVELDHGNEIITELLNGMIDHFKSLLTICKLEGDAVFATASAERVERGETLLELFDATYAGFREQVGQAVRLTTCQCRACQAMPGLDLKFFVHFGDYMEQNIAGIRDLVGPDVNLAHRLMKNRVSQATGWQGYALLTEAALNRLGIRPDGLFEQTETYDLGDVLTFSFDLRSRYEETRRSRRVFVRHEEADVVTSLDYPQPPTVVWDWLNDPIKRSLYAPDPSAVFKPVSLPGGRTGMGAQTHCVHGDKLAMVETILDWQPFDYYTIRLVTGPLDEQVTFWLTPTADGGTHLEICELGKLTSVRPLDRAVYRFLLTRVIPTQRMFTAMGERMAADNLAQAPGEQVLSSHRNE